MELLIIQVGAVDISLGLDPNNGNQVFYQNESVSWYYPKYLALSNGTLSIRVQTECHTLTSIISANKETSLEREVFPPVIT
jgi:hypothetical protein